MQAICAEKIWKSIESVVQERIATPSISRMLGQFSSAERFAVLASYMVTAGIDFVEQFAQWRWSSVQQIATAQHVIPNGDALDKILRYETTIERQLGRSVDRLERLQRRRQGEMIPPPASVHLTR